MEKGGRDSADNQYHVGMAHAKKPRKRSAKKLRHRRIIIILVLILFVAGIGAWLLPLPALSATASLEYPSTSTLKISWPAYGEAAIGAEGYGILDSYGVQKMVPTASVAKIITALTVLKQNPLSLGQQGATITLGNSDVANYNHYLSLDGSVIKVVSGEQITEYQAIEAMLIPSANNMADSLAIWAFGTLTNYISAANQLLKSLGLSNTIVAGDASGFLPSTESTADNLVELGEIALHNPVISQIVSEKSVILPEAGLVKNVNWLIGEDGIIGIKTGNTDQAGGVYLFAANHLVSTATSITIVGAIMGAPTLQDALDDSVPLLTSSENNFISDNVISSGEVVGYYIAPWNKTKVEAAATRNVSIPVWRGSKLTPQVALTAIYAPKESGSAVGTINVSVNGSTYSSPVTLSRNISNPPWYWRVFGRFDWQKLHHS